ncbi:MAG TPA: FKBP-type peptidyl-prolyl cis-trans isomerase [Acidimicrobiales bacterium]|nr:FKBP-type peptidyl-prolyl cis-trans isomerase [Acidimicrobiales bacterium]
MATDKRERQRAARLEKNVAEATAAKREKTKRTAIRVVLAAAVVLAVLFGVSQLMGDDADDGDDATTAADTEATTTVPTTEPPPPEYTNPELAEEVLGREPPEPTPPPEDTAGDALETTTLIEGEGEGAQAGDIVTVHYVGVLSDGTTFDESWSRGEPFQVPVGQGAVIPGWDEGLIGATIGERRHLLIGADNAYGEADQGAIPPNSPLAFDVDVVDIQPGG